MWGKCGGLAKDSGMGCSGGTPALGEGGEEVWGKCGGLTKDSGMGCGGGARALSGGRGRGGLEVRRTQE